MASDPAQFLWSDAWLLEAVVVASRTGPATLAEIIGCADGINHAILCNDEIHGGLVRLTAAGFVEEVDQCFGSTNEVPEKLKGRDGYREFLEAEPWSPETSTRQPANEGVVYPGLTDAHVEQAIREYQQSVRRSK